MAGCIVTINQVRALLHFVIHSSGPIVQCCALLHCFSKHDHHFHVPFADSATVAVSHTKDDDSVTLQKLTSVSSDASEPLSTPSFDPRDEEAL